MHDTRLLKLRSSLFILLMPAWLTVASTLDPTDFDQDVAYDPYIGSALAAVGGDYVEGDKWYYHEEHLASMSDGVPYPSYPSWYFYEAIYLPDGERVVFHRETGDTAYAVRHYYLYASEAGSIATLTNYLYGLSIQAYAIIGPPGGGV